MLRDRLFLLSPGFEDPAYPGQRFYCWHCALIEGVLASFPELAARIDVQRIPWPRPRREVATLIGEENQSLPVLILARNAPDDITARRYGEERFIDDKDAILGVLSRRHGIPVAHP
ncbi:MAG: DUF3088 domain-containing protein [Hyphomicrobiaceae bacterium]|nr:DUF3088 domain-containing protein [Hyphomicrobiaceae bacterium]